MAHLVITADKGRDAGDGPPRARHAGLWRPWLPIAGLVLCAGCPSTPTPSSEPPPLECQLHTTEARQLGAEARVQPYRLRCRSTERKIILSGLTAAISNRVYGTPAHAPKRQTSASWPALWSVTASPSS